jgi:hypothetical protein
MEIDKDKLKSVLEYCLANLKHPQSQINTFYEYPQYSTTGYYVPPIKNYDQLIKDANQDYENKVKSAQNTLYYEEALRDIKFFLSKL